MADSDPKTKEMQESAVKYWAETGFSEGGLIREVDYSQESKGLDPMFAGIKIVDTDAHLTEAPDLFTSRAPASMKDKMPRIKRIDGRDRWYLGERDLGATGGNVIRKDNNKLLGRFAFQNLDQSHPGGHELAPRLQAMDDMGVHAQICYQNSGVTQAGMLMTLDDKDLAHSIVSIYNDASAEYQQTSGQRIFNMAHLPYWDQKAMMAEARRCIDMGLKGFVLPDTPEFVGVPSFMNDYWTEFLELCSDTGTPLNFHLNASINPFQMTWKDFEFEQGLAVVAMMFSMGNAATMGNWMVSGKLDQHPGLKIGLIESGAGWVPWAVEALEHQFREMLSGKRDTLKKSPWEYWHDHFWCTFWFESVGPKDLLHRIGEDKIMFETDFPHPTSLYPGVQAHLKDVLGGYSYEVQKKILQDNAVKLYNLPF
jgi:predicted TIM-barrel fold metal-dependent hydrolase